MNLRTWLSALAVSVGISSVSFAQLTGTVTLEGEPPEPEMIDMSAVRDCAAAHVDPVWEDMVLVDEEGRLENVVISIQAPEGMDLPGEVPEEPAVLDQQGCMYAPRVLPMMTGQEWIVKNSDPFMHNVNAQPRVNPGFNISQPNVDPGRQVQSPRVPETFRVRCDVHPWMSAYVRAFDHPYFDRTDQAGAFSIDVGELFDGEYTVVAWHEQYGEQQQQVTIENGQGEVNFTFDAASARATPIEVREVILASEMADDEKQSAGCGAACCVRD